MAAWARWGLAALAVGAIAGWFAFRLAAPPPPAPAQPTSAGAPRGADPAPAPRAEPTPAAPPPVAGAPSSVAEAAPSLPEPAGSPGEEATPLPGGGGGEVVVVDATTGAPLAGVSVGFL